MSVVAVPNVAPPAPLKVAVFPTPFPKGDDWHRALGGVPLDRVIFNPAPGTVTFEYYESIDGRVNGVLVELVDGTLVEKTMGQKESAIAGNVAFEVKLITRARGAGLVTVADGMVRMVRGNVRMPDVTYYAPEDHDAAELERRKAPAFRPTIAVEVLSESNTAAEIDRKLREYFESGARLAWVLDPPTRTLRVYTDADTSRLLTADDELDGGDVLAEFRVKVADLFAIDKG